MSLLRELVFLVYLVLEDEFAPAMHPTEFGGLTEAGSGA
jgi:hypothetical protein